MTKRDFRTRRNLFQGAIRKQRDFHSFRKTYEKKKKRQGASRVILLVLIGLVLALYYFLGFVNPV